MNFKKLLISFLLLFPIIIFAQIGGEDEVYLSGDRVEAKFRGGGIDKFSEFVQQEFNYSKATKAGQMIAAFTVDVDGSIKNIKLIKMLDVESATEMIRVLNKCPKWEPAKRGGKPISIEIKYPMTFNVRLPESQVRPETNDSNPPKIKSLTQEPGGENKIYNTAGIERKPEFPGGMEAFYNYVAKNYKTPNKPGLKGKVYVSFVVEKDGSIADIKVLRDIGYGTGKEAVRVLSQSPAWNPGEQQGKKVRVLYSLPINIMVP